MKTYLRFSVAALACLIVLAACKVPALDLPKQLGSLTILVTDSSSSARTIMPSAADMTVTTFVFSGTGPASEIIAETSQASATFSATSIAAGDWTITVRGKNAAGAIVAEATKLVVVPGGGTANDTISLQQLSGSGTLALTVTWPGTVIVDSAVATLTPEGGAAEDITLIIAGSQATFTGARSAGSYSLVLNLKKESQSLAPPRLESVLLYAAIVSTGTIDMTAVDFAGGGSVAAPVFSLAAATYDNTQILSMTSTTLGATIRYTTDGSIPTGTVGTLYTGPLSVATTQTVNAIAYLSSWTNSVVTSADYAMLCGSPTFSIVVGTYTNIQSLVLSTRTTGASIYYTTDGSTPSSGNGTLFSGSISIGTSETIKALAVRADFADSSVTSGAYTLECAAPVFGLVAGSYETPKTLTLTSATSSATIYYTTDGTTPSSINGTLYSRDITIGTSETVKAIALYSGFADSSVTSATYALKCVAPVFGISAGTYDLPQSLTIATTTSGASIRYTVDGSAPSTTNGTVYSGAFSVASSQTVKAIAYFEGFVDWDVASASYVILNMLGAPTFSPAAGTYATTQNMTLATTTPGASMRYTTDGSDPTSSVGTLYVGGISVTTSQTIKAVAYLSGWPDSSMSSAAYVINGTLGMNVTVPSRIILTGPSIAQSGGIFSATVTPTGTGTVDSYDWYLDGIHVAGATTNSLPIATSMGKYVHSLVAVAKSGASSFSSSVSFSLIDAVGTLAGSGTAGSIDATGSAASFNAPAGISVDASGSIYVADSANNKIRKITSAGVVTTLAGSATAGSTNATGSAASFNTPCGVAVDASGNVYVADRGNNKIRKITSAGVVTTLAGSGTAGSIDATGSAASFNAPAGISVDASGNIYVADSANNKIRKITSAGVVTTLAGSGTVGSTNATGSAASFYNPCGVAVDASGNVYVADTYGHKIRKITSAGEVTTLAGSGTAGSIDATGMSASFRFPFGVAVDVSGNIYVADSANDKIRKITSAGVVITLAGLSSSGSTDGLGAATFDYPKGIVMNTSGFLYVADAIGNIIRAINP